MEELKTICKDSFPFCEPNDPEYENKVREKFLHHPYMDNYLRGKLETISLEKIV